jgi:hypothetical protein
MLNFRRITMGFSLGGLLKAVAPLALTIATGGAAAPALLNMAMKMAVQMAMQKVCQELGLPPAFAQLASAALTGGQQGAGSAGGFEQILRQGGASANDIGQIMRTADGVGRAAGDLFRNFGNMSPEQFEALPDAFNKLADQYRAKGGKENEQIADSYQDFAQKIASQNFMNSIKTGDRNFNRDMEAALKGTKSPMMKLAIVLGMLADKKSDDMMSKAKQIGQFGEVTQKKQGQFQQMNSELQALGQELGVLSQAMSNVIKSMGEASTTLARKG